MGLLDNISKKAAGTGKSREKRGKVEEKKAKKAKKPSEKKAEKKVKKVRVHSNAARVLKKPVISEKAAFMEADGKYVFSVCTHASKNDVRRAVAMLYNVTPVKVNIINVLGNKNRSGHKMRKPSSYKKAIVTLSKGESIQLYEGV